MVRALVLGLVCASGASAARAQAPGWHGVAAARSGGTIAVWDAGHVRVSHDEGVTFPDTYLPPSTMASAPGTVVEVDDDGTLLVRWGDSWADVPVELIAPDGTRTRVADHGAVDVAAGHGTRAAIVGTELRVAFGDDAFDVVAIPPAVDDCGPCHGQLRLGIDADGSVLVTDVEIDTCGSSDSVEWQRLVFYAAGDTAMRSRSLLLPESEGGAVLEPGLRGWAYGVTRAGTPWARAVTGSTDIENMGRGAGYALMPLATNGRIVVTLWDGALREIRAGAATVLADGVGELVSLAIDARSRVLAIDEGGAVVRFSRRGVSSTLLAAETAAAATARPP